MQKCILFEEGYRTQDYGENPSPSRKRQAKYSEASPNSRGTFHAFYPVSAPVGENRSPSQRDARQRKMTTKVQEVTGLILHFRTPKATIECIHSLAPEGIRRVVLVDNSEDGGQSLDAMTTPLTELHGQGMDIRVINFGCNLGFAKGVNVGLAQAVLGGASAILLINSDATVVTGSISQLTQGLETADVVIPRVRTEPGTETSLFGYYHTMAATLAKSPGARHLKYASGCCMLIRSEVARGNIFDEDFFFYGEDVALANSHIKHGINVKEVSSALIVHAGSGSSKMAHSFMNITLTGGIGCWLVN